MRLSTARSTMTGLAGLTISFGVIASANAQQGLFSPSSRMPKTVRTPQTQTTRAIQQRGVRHPYSPAMVQGRAQSSATSSARGITSMAPIANQYPATSNTVGNNNSGFAPQNSLPNSLPNSTVSSTSTSPGFAPIGSSNISPRARGFQYTGPVYLQNTSNGLGPALGTDRQTPLQGSDVLVDRAADVVSNDPKQLGDGSFEFMPHDDLPPDEPVNSPTYRPTLSTSLPYGLSVPTHVPVGRSTGHATRLGRPGRQPSAYDPETMGTPTMELGPAPPANSRCLDEYPVGGIGATPPEKMSGPKAGPPGLGVRYYDRYLNGTYGETDVSARTQSRIRGAQLSGEIP